MRMTFFVDSEPTLTVIGVGSTLTGVGLTLTVGFIPLIAWAMLSSAAIIGSGFAASALLDINEVIDVPATNAAAIAKISIVFVTNP